VRDSTAWTTGIPEHRVAPPRVGRKLLAPYLITICNNEGVVYFEKLMENVESEEETVEKRGKWGLSSKEPLE